MAVSAGHRNCDFREMRNNGRAKSSVLRQFNEFATASGIANDREAQVALRENARLSCLSVDVPAIVLCVRGRKGPTYCSFDDGTTSSSMSKSKVMSFLMVAEAATTPC